jgi:hypothetical protein
MAAVKINGAKLKSLREWRFLTREELAEKVGSHRDHIGRLKPWTLTRASYSQTMPKPTLKQHSNHAN